MECDRIKIAQFFLELKSIRITIDMHKKLLLFFRVACVYERGDSWLIAIKSRRDIQNNYYVTICQIN